MIAISEDMMNKHLLASIYEIRGEKKKVARIYRDILSLDPNDIEAEESLRRLATRSINISGLNLDMYNIFLNADSKEKLIELERWLVGY